MLRLNFLDSHQHVLIATHSRILGDEQVKDMLAPVPSEHGYSHQYTRHNEKSPIYKRYIQYYNWDDIMTEKLLVFINVDTIDEQEFERIYKLFKEINGASN